MASVVWKYTLHITDRQEVEMPKGAKLLHVGIQHSSLQLWVLIEGVPAYTTRTILICGTGHEREDVNEKTPYVGSFITQGGSLVFHVFDGGEVA